MSVDGSALTSECVNHYNISAYAVIYNLLDQEWIVLDSVWSEIHLFYDEVSQTHRLVGWAPSDHRILLNAELSNNCQYYLKTEDFHKFIDADKIVYGLGFHTSPESTKQAQNFLAVIRSVLGSDQDKASLIAHKSNLFIPSLTPSHHNIHTQHVPPTPPAFKLGKLEIGKAKAARSASSLSSNSTNDNDTQISDPLEVCHQQHVTYDPHTQQYKGLPQKWLEEISKQFGVPLEECDCVKVDGYTARIPRVLVLLRRHFQQDGGSSVEGVFRLAPNADACAIVKAEIQAGVFESCNDVHVLANLVKVYFRDMPVSLLDPIDKKALSQCTTINEAGNLVESLLPVSYCSLLKWLLDLCVDVSSHAEQNKMTPKNLAIVIAPNLFVVKDLDPMASLIYSQKVANFFCLAIQYRALS